LYVASNFVTGTVNAGHLQFVYNLDEAEVQAPYFIIGNWDYQYGLKHSEMTNNYQEAGKYFIRAATLRPEQDAFYVWTLIGQIVDSMEVTGANLDYIPTTQNSNSFVRTVTYVIGLETDWSVALSGGEIERFPGYSRNVLFEAELGFIASSGIALNLAGTDGNDFIRTGNGADSLSGGAGNDTIYGGDGIDIIYGGTDSDSIDGGAEFDALFGGEENDYIRGNLGNDVIDGGSGFDEVYGGADNDILSESFNLSNQQDGGLLFGGSGDDKVDVSRSADRSELYGGSGNDTLIGNGASFIYGGSGADEIRISTTSTVPGARGDTIVGADQTDTLWIDGIQIAENSPDIIFWYRNRGSKVVRPTLYPNTTGGSEHSGRHNGICSIRHRCADLVAF